MDLSVGERLVEAGGILGSFGGFQDRTALQAFDVLRVGVFGDELRSGVAAGCRVVHGMCPLISAS